MSDLKQFRYLKSIIQRLHEQDKLQNGEYEKLMVAVKELIDDEMVRRENNASD